MTSSAGGRFLFDVPEVDMNDQRFSKVPFDLQSDGFD